MQMRAGIAHAGRGGPGIQHGADAVLQRVLVDDDGDVAQQLQADARAGDVPEAAVQGVHDSAHGVRVVFGEGDVDMAVLAQMGGFAEVASQ